MKKTALTIIFSAVAIKSTFDPPMTTSTKQERETRKLHQKKNRL